MPKPNTLLCTIGVSLFYPNLSNLAKETQTDPHLCNLAEAYSEAVKEQQRRKRDGSAQRVPHKEWEQVGTLLHKMSPTERLCGAEINSVTDLLTQGSIEQDRLHLFYSDTDDGEAIAKVLESYFTDISWNVNIHRVEGLRDDAPDKFRTQGLRNLAKLFGEQVREARKENRSCAINATGGYKAQIAIAVLMGQALDIPVYYKHERFDDIIPFPPMPVALDFSLWERASGMFTVLAKDNACEPWERFENEWDERFEPLVNRVRIKGEDCLELSATGQIFHETFHSRFQQLKVTHLPRDADNQEAPRLREHNYTRQQRRYILKFLKDVTNARPYVRYCESTYWNPDLPESTRFRLSQYGHVEGIYSNGTWCVNFRVITTAEDEDQLSVIVADLNDWLK